MASAMRLLAAACLAALPTLAAAKVPTGFQDATVASGLSQPAGLAFAPDGRLFVAEKTGRLRVVKNGALLAAPFIDVATLVAPPATFDTYAERGLLGVAVDPGFPGAPFVYLYYSVCEVPGASACQVAKNRVARVSAGHQGNPDRGDPASQVVLLDDIDSDSGIHNAGWLGFGPLDGKLYVSVGDGGADRTKAQDTGSLNGKILRLESSGAVPADNPFVGLFGARPEVYALGLRNPWRCRFHHDGRLFCGDVGQAAWEEIDWIVAGANYGWPVTEGDFDPIAHPDFTRPLHAIDHTGAGSITGGDFGSETSFPGDYQQSYFFGDYSWQWIRRAVLGPDGVTVVSVSDFATTIGGVTDLVAGPDGALWYTNIFDGTVHRIAATGANTPPVARAAATPAQGAAPLTVQFSGVASTDGDGDPLTLVWDFGDGTPPVTAPEPVHVYDAAGAYTATLTVSDGGLPIPGTDSVTIPITVGTPPAVAITSPAADSPFQGGQVIPLSGSATDAEDGPLPTSALRWEIRFHHADHWHPFLNDVPGSPQSFVTATGGEQAADVSYRIILRATDSSGLTSETSRWILPRTVTLRLETDPPGLGLTLDGQPVIAPHQVTGVVGIVRTIGAISPQGGRVFAGWSDGGVQVHTITTPATDVTYTARFSGSGGTTSTTTAPSSTTSSTTSTSTTSTTTTTTSTTTSTATTSTSTTSTSVTTSTTTSTTSTSVTTSTSTTTTSTTSSTGASTTSTTASTVPATTSTTSSSSTTTSSVALSTSTTTTAGPATTTSTTAPPAGETGCSPALTSAGVLCRLEEARAALDEMSPETDYLRPGLDRRLRLARVGIERAASQCAAGRLTRARATLRGARRRVGRALARVTPRPGRPPIEGGATVEARLDALATDLKLLRDTLACR